MILLIDNYDSFTFNLYHYLGELGAKVLVKRNDAVSLDDIIRLSPEAIVLSPGPCTPNEAGITLEVIKNLGRSIPIMGVCLGMQAMGQAYGGRVIRAPHLMHGKTSEIRHTGRSVFRGINHPFTATRYHSLIVERETLPSTLEITAETSDGLIMGLAHKEDPVHGVQFHPESIASEHGHDLLRTFLSIASEWNKRKLLA